MFTFLSETEVHFKRKQRYEGFYLLVDFLTHKYIYTRYNEYDTGIPVSLCHKLWFSYPISLQPNARVYGKDYFFFMQMMENNLIKERKIDEKKNERKNLLILCENLLNQNLIQFYITNFNIKCLTFFITNYVYIKLCLNWTIKPFFAESLIVLLRGIKP